MSRVGKQPVKIPEKVKVAIAGGLIKVEGPQGKLQQIIDPFVEVSVASGTVVVKPLKESREASARHGLMRNLVQNMVQGASVGFKKSLHISGVGYRADVKGKDIHMTLGFSHPITFPIPDGIKVQIEKQTKIHISGPSKELVGETAARIRKYKKPEPYKGKGIKYENEVIKRKVGKAAAGSGGGK